MAEQSITVANMPDSGSPARVALELAHLCITQEGWDAFKTRGPILNLYTECLRAAQGVRPPS